MIEGTQEDGSEDGLEEDEMRGSGWEEGKN